MVKDGQRRTSKTRKVLDQINSLRQEDETLYNILAVDVWALAKTMDEVEPGFWAAFMKNRDKALKRLMNEMAQQQEGGDRRPPFLH